MSTNDKVYYFACDSLWGILALLTEKVGTRENSFFYLKWSAQYSKITNWALQEKSFSEEKFTRDEQENFVPRAEVAGDALIAQWDKSLHEVAHSAYEAYPSLSEPVWLYYYYCRFLQRVLVEFDGIIQEDLTPYFQRYQASKFLFNNLSSTLEYERPFFGPEVSIDKTIAGNLLTDLDTFAVRSGEHWRDAILSAVKNT
jgi:hypothetical protein